ncbi:properdin, partial [Coturnix japonica]|uniref:properdin n=1 Tax=Coturnix japonica TaxID=93934 RepID=UPI0007771E1A
GGAWGEWSQWGPCGVTCRGKGSTSVRSRKRKCDNPAPSVEPPGSPCPGEGTEVGECPGLPPCPVDGAWSPWAELTPCHVTCGLGVVTWKRSCDAPPPQHGGRGCHGNSTK